MSGFIGLLAPRKLFNLFLLSNVLIIFTHTSIHLTQESTLGFPELATQLQLGGLLPPQQSSGILQKAILDFVAICLAIGVPLVFACIMTLSARSAQILIIERHPVRMVRRAIGRSTTAFVKHLMSRARVEPANRPIADNANINEGRAKEGIIQRGLSDAIERIFNPATGTGRDGTIRLKAYTIWQTVEEANSQKVGDGELVRSFIQALDAADFQPSERADILAELLQVNFGRPGGEADV
jgi:hypothetical protein